jgi:hypothetical protein
MRKLIVFNIISLDGYYTGPVNNVMVMPMGGVFDAYTIERLHVAETVLLGRVTYEMFRSFWASVADDLSPGWTPTCVEKASYPSAFTCLRVVPPLGQSSPSERPGSEDRRAHSVPAAQAKAPLPARYYMVSLKRPILLSEREERPCCQ